MGAHERKDQIMDSNLLERLLESQEPSICYKTRVLLMDADPYSEEVYNLQEDVKTSRRVQTLLSQRDGEGRIPGHPYKKWTGAHWTLVALADLGYPPGDLSLVPLREQVYDWLYSEKHITSIFAIKGRVRRCSSQEGNALYALMRLGLADNRTLQLAESLTRWQWPDGGWNCDKRPEAMNSSFMETLIPLRALTLYARLSSDTKSAQTALRASEVFLRRNLFRRTSDGSVIHPDFTKLHYPPYWHYDILFALQVMAETGFIGDPRCAQALDLLESKRLPGGGFPAEGRYYTTGERAPSNRSLVDWGGVSKKKMNEFVTVNALYVLKAAGRL